MALSTLFAAVPGQRKSPDFNSLRAVSQIAPPDAFSAGEALEYQCAGVVKFQVSPWGKRRVSGRVVSETRHLNRRL